MIVGQGTKQTSGTAFHLSRTGAPLERRPAPHIYETMYIVVDEATNTRLAWRARSFSATWRLCEGQFEYMRRAHPRADKACNGV